MDKRNILLLSGLLIVLILVAVIIFDNDEHKNVPTPISEQTKAISESADKIVSGKAEIDPFRAEVPANIKVPELNEPLTEDQKKEIAVPEIVVGTTPGADSQYRSFEIRGEGDKFIPEKVIANVGDIINIKFTAVDKDYDIRFPSYKMSQKAKAGETKILQFSANKSGSFLYYCPSCGGPEAGPTGQIIIVE